MVQQFEHHPNDYDQWTAYDALDIPVLVMRGERSDLLLPDTARAMTQRGPRARLVEVGGCGHAPALNTIEHFRIVESFFSAP
jgi:pimeloyl-ACP methyl ester carboxylesterase